MECWRLPGGEELEAKLRNWVREGSVHVRRKLGLGFA